MDITFIDFVPKRLAKGGLLSSARYENIEVTVRKMNQWKDENSSIEIKNIETILLPNIYNPNEEGNKDVDIRTHANMTTNWYQVIRVWYIVTV